MEPELADAYTLHNYYQSKLTIYYKFDSSVSWSDTMGKRIKDGYNHAINVWNSALNNKTMTKYGKKYRYEFKAANTSNPATLTLSRYSKKNDGKRGHTPTSVNKNLIKSATVYLNATEITNATLSKHVATHELGHVLGINHGGTKNSIMYVKKDRNDNIVKPTTDDINAAYANLKKTVAYAIKPVQVPGSRKNSKGLGYAGHVQDLGDAASVCDGQTAGAVGYSTRLENFRFVGIPYPIARIDVEVHIQGQGWVKYTNIKASQRLGTSGKSLRIEAIRIKAYDRNGKVININYQVHQQDYGWSAVKKNGETAGVTGKSLRIEAIRIWLP